MPILVQILNMLKLISFFGLSILFLFSCESTSNDTQIAKHFSNEELAYPVNLEQGKRLMESKCYVCHNPKLAESQLIAPPMIAVKDAYMSEDFATFLANMKNWLNNPDIAHSKMPDAIDKYGIMPKQHYPEESIELIANFMFRAPIEEPTWWNGNTESNSQNKKQSFDSYEEKGLHFATTTKQVLGKNLMGTIQREGTLAALTFCNTAAIPLTDSMAQVHNAKIKRVSDKPRNPNNQANENELKHIEYFKNQLNSGKEVKPILEEDADVVQFYYPIETNSMCLQCHGNTNKEINSDVVAQLRQLYPLDMAVGYSENQVRGIWSISFKK